MVSLDENEPPASTGPTRFVTERLRERNRLSQHLFEREAEPLARACQAMSERFLRGGRLLAFGRDQYATDAQHVSVEFVHPVIVGKRALPALDLSLSFERWLPAIVRSDDIVMGFGPPTGDPRVQSALDIARDRGAQTFALPSAGPGASSSDVETGDHYALSAFTDDPFLHQELIEVLYHTLWETVHVFFEHRELGHDIGRAAFLYPFLGKSKQDTTSVVAQVAASIRTKAAEVERLRDQVASRQGDAIVNTAAALRARIDAGGTLLLFGNGGSATDANDWALDCVHPIGDRPPIAAVSLAMEAANVTAIANDIGPEAIFLRQLIAQARPEDVAIGISTSGGSGNVLLALEEARKRGMLKVALLGYDGGEVMRRGLADHAVVVDCDHIPRIQEIQASVYHLILELLGSGLELSTTARSQGADQRERSVETRAGALELYGGGSCHFTSELREHLDWQGESFTEYDVETDVEARQRLAELVALPSAELRVPVLIENGEVREIGWRGRSCSVAGPGPSCDPPESDREPDPQ